MDLTLVLKIHSIIMFYVENMGIWCAAKYHKSCLTRKQRIWSMNQDSISLLLMLWKNILWIEGMLKCSRTHGDNRRTEWLIMTYIFVLGPLGGRMFLNFFILYKLWFVEKNPLACWLNEYKFYEIETFFLIKSFE